MNIKPHIKIEKYNEYKLGVKNNPHFQEYVKNNSEQYASRRLTRLTAFCYALDENIDTLIAETNVEKILEMINTFEQYQTEHEYTQESIKTEKSTIRGFYQFLGIKLPRKNEPINQFYTKDIEQSKSFNTFNKLKTREQSTLRRYKITLTSYCNFHQMKIDDLIEEADQEEEQGIRENKRKIKDRIIEFRSYMRNNNYGASTIKSRITNLKTFYRANGITIPYIEQDTNQYERKLRYDEIPKKQHIKTAIETTTNIRNRAMFLFMSTSGSGSNETRHMTIKQYMEGTKELHGETKDIQKALEKMEGELEFIPVFPMIRIKNKFEYYACITPEANQFIINYLKTRENLSLDDKLFDINEYGVNYAYATVNDKNNWGWVKDHTHRFFASHQMRRYHYNVIEDRELAHTLEGRQFTKTEEAYYARDPKKLREKYKRFLEKFTIYEKYQIKVITDENYEEISRVMEEKDKRIEELEEELQKQRLEQKNKQEEFENRLNQVEKGLPHLDKTNDESNKLNLEKLNIKIELESYINNRLEFKDRYLTKLDKKIQNLTENEIQALIEISYDTAINDEKFKKTTEIKPIIEKAIIRMKTNPKLMEETMQFYEERKINNEKLRKYHNLLYDKLVELDLWDKETIENLCDKISLNFNQNVDKILIEEITEEYVLKDIEEYI